MADDGEQGAASVSTPAPAAASADAGAASAEDASPGAVSTSPTAGDGITEAALGEGEAVEGEEEVLACGKCLHPLVSSPDLITDKISSWAEAVYAYQLEVLDLDDVWCYSATNPGQHRFDVARARPTCRGISLTGEPTPEHSWFPGFNWSFAHCGACDAHLGWGFQPSPEEGAAAAAAAPEVAFYGLVLTKLTPRRLPPGGMEAAEARLSAIREHHDQYRSDMSATLGMLNRLPVALASQFYPALFAMDQNPSDRTDSGSILAAVREVFAGWGGESRPDGDSPFTTDDSGDEADYASDGALDEPGGHEGSEGEGAMDVADVGPSGTTDEVDDGTDAS